MTRIELKTSDQVLTVITRPTIASGDQNTVGINVCFDRSWDGYNKTATFFTANHTEVYEVILVDDCCVVPAEVLAAPGTLYIGIRGIKANDEKVKTSALASYRIKEGAPVGTATAMPPTPDVYQQLLQMMKQNNKAVLYDEQNLTDGEKAQARKNIGALGAEELEGEVISNAVADYLEKNPIETGATEEEAKQIEQNKTDIERLSKEKLDADRLTEAVEDALAQAKESGEFDGKDGDDYTLTEADKEEIRDMVLDDIVDVTPAEVHVGVDEPTNGEPLWIDTDDDDEDDDTPSDAVVVAPHIGENGNWYIGETDTGVKAKGEDAEDGYSIYVSAVALRMRTRAADLDDGGSGAPVIGYCNKSDLVTLGERQPQVGDLIVDPVGDLWRVTDVYANGAIYGNFVVSLAAEVTGKADRTEVPNAATVEDNNLVMMRDENPLFSVPLPVGGGSGGETGGELVGTWSTEEEVEMFTVTLDEPIDDSYLIEFKFVGTTTNTAKKKPIIYVNGKQSRYLSAEALYNTEPISAVWSFAYLKSLAMLMEMDVQGFLYDQMTGDRFSMSKTMNKPAVQIKNHEENAHKLSSIGMSANGGVFGVGSAIRVYRLKGI